MRSKSTKAKRTRGEGVTEAREPTINQRRRGRPEEYEPEIMARACRLAVQGYDMQEIADDLEINRSTLWAWRQKYPEFSNAIKAAAGIADDQVEFALQRTAREGNTTAQIFWLKNRRPQQWRDRHETEIVIPISDPSDGPEMGARELALAGLALFSAAAYDATTEPKGPLIEGNANVEENDDGDDFERNEPPAGAGRRAVGPGRGSAPDFDFDDD